MKVRQLGQDTHDTLTIGIGRDRQGHDAHRPALNNVPLFVAQNGSSVGEFNMHVHVRRLH